MHAGSWACMVSNVWWEQAGLNSTDYLKQAYALQQHAPVAAARYLPAAACFYCCFLGQQPADAPWNIDRLILWFCPCPW